MSQAGLLAIVASALPGLGSQPGAAEDPLRVTLKLGEIIRGRVMRSMGEGRYVVNFHGHERVVDSAIPLRTDDILHGRVVAVGDRIELQRVRTEPAQAARGDAPETTQQDPMQAPALSAQIQQLIASWSAEDQAAVGRLLGAAPDPGSLMLTVSAVARSGLPGPGQLVELVYSTVSRQGENGLFPPRTEAVAMATAPAKAERDAVAGNPTALAALAEQLRTSFDASRQALLREAERDKHDAEPVGDGDEDARASSSEQSGQGSGAATEASLVAGFLNGQTGGAVAHAVTTIPLIVDGRLVELDVALFGEHGGGRNGAALPHGRVVIELTTEHLGRVHIDANLVGRHVQIGLASDVAEAAEFMAQHAPALRSRIEADGWSVDGLRYEVRERETVNGAAKVVMEHQMSADSLSRLI